MNVQANVFAYEQDVVFSIDKQQYLTDSYTVKVGEATLYFNHARLEEFTDMLRDFMQANPVASNALGVSVAAEPFNDFDDEIPC